MAERYLVEFEYVEPLSFRAMGDLHPTSVGPSSHSATNPYPLPTTLLGALITCLGIYRGGRGGYREWYEAYRANVEPPVTGVGTLHALRGSEKYLLLRQGLLRVSPGKPVLVEAGTLQLTRVSLEDAYKRAKEGYLFSSTLIHYLKGLRLALEVKFDASLGLLEGGLEEPCTLGGFSRISRLRVQRAGDESPLYESYVKSGNAVLVVATPVLLRTDKYVEGLLRPHLYPAMFTREENGGGRGKPTAAEYLSSLVVEEQPPELREALESMTLHMDESKLYVAPANAGWDYSLGVRRPYYAVILPGSRLAVTLNSEIDASAFYWHGVGIAAEAGYGRLAILPAEAGRLL